MAAESKNRQAELIVQPRFDMFLLRMNPFLHLAMDAKN